MIATSATSQKSLGKTLGWISIFRGKSKQIYIIKRKWCTSKFE
jgi:hypothetical protein